MYAYYGAPSVTTAGQKPSARTQSVALRGRRDVVRPSSGERQAAVASFDPWLELHGRLFYFSLFFSNSPSVILAIFCLSVVSFTR